MKNSLLKNQSGMITVDFIFAIVLILGFSGLLFVLTFTLSVASITQYVTFAAARMYAVANIDEETQIARGQAKYHELIANPVFKPLYSNGWYKVNADANIGDHTKLIQGYQQAAESKNQFWGAGTDFVARILDFKIPFFGSTAPDGDGTGSGFKTYMGSYLGREPSSAECIDFTSARWKSIRKMTVSQGASYSTGTSDSGYYPMTDDGC